VYRPREEAGAELKTIEMDPEEKEKEIEEPLVDYVLSLFRAHLLIP